MQMVALKGVNLDRVEQDMISQKHKHSFWTLVWYYFAVLSFQIAVEVGIEAANKF